MTSSVSDQFSCPHCNHTIERRIHSLADSIVCGNCCHMFLKSDSYHTPTVEYIGKKEGPYLPLGSKGKLKGVPYEVVGFLNVKEIGRVYRWKEYVLYNREQGFVFLSEYEGHWSLFRHIDPHEIERNGSEHYYKDNTFLLFNRHKAEVLYAEGEFPWRVDDKPRVWEYVCPPYGLNYSVTDTSSEWMLGEYLKPSQVKEAFNMKQRPPDRYGKGAMEPFKTVLPYKDILLPTFIVGVVILFLQALFSFHSEENVLASREFQLPENVNANSAEPIPGPRFEIKDEGLLTDNLLFHLYADVDNFWFATGITMLHEESGKEYDFEMGVEYYFGYEGGSRWSEGNKREEKLLSAMPAGHYQMLVYPYKPANRRLSKFRLTIMKDTPIWSNFWIILLLLFLIPLIQYFREYWHENARWSNSDYNPYNS